MRRFRAALVGGLVSARQIWLIGPLYLWGLLLGLIQTWPLLLASQKGALQNPFLNQLVIGGSDALVNLFISTPTAGAQAFVWSIAAIGLLALFGLGYNFFSGGMLSVCAQTRPFWAGCRRMFWSFTGLGFLLIVLMLSIVVGVGVLLIILHASATFSIITTVVIIQLLNLVGEYARAIAVIHEQRNPLILLGRAVTFCIRHFPGVLLLGLLGLLLHAGLAALLGILTTIHGGTIITIVWQQAIIIAWLWVKFLRLTWALRYVQASTEAEGTPPGRETPVPVMT